jgi:hypothetical protein
MWEDIQMERLVLKLLNCLMEGIFERIIWGYS